METIISVKNPVNYKHISISVYFLQKTQFMYTFYFLFIAF